MAAARIECDTTDMFQESLQASSTISLKDALQQAKETAQKLDREIFESQKYRAQIQKHSDEKRGGEIVNLQMYDLPKYTNQMKGGKENESK